MKSRLRHKRIKPRPRRRKREAEFDDEELMIGTPDKNTKDAKK
jgi:hypothetical protein